MEVSHIRATQLGMLTRKRAPVTPDEIAALRDTLARAPFVTAVAWGEQEVFNPGWIGEAIKTQIVLQDEHYHIIPAAGHNIHSDNPAASAKVISQYL
jgi:pimeloyl-ACP methyl ester carboxylesterase